MRDELGGQYSWLGAHDRRFQSSAGPALVGQSQARPSLNLEAYPLGQQLLFLAIRAWWRYRLYALKGSTNVRVAVACHPVKAQPRESRGPRAVVLRAHKLLRLPRHSDESLLSHYPSCRIALARRAAVRRRKET